MGFSGEGAMTGATAGAGIGTFILPGVGTAIGAGLGAIGGGLLMPGAKKVKRPDITAELAKISALFDEQKKATREAINIDAGQTRAAAASSMASRGTYRSPVAENVFGKLDQNRVNALSQALAGIGVQEANVRASMLAQLLGYDQQVQAQQAQAQSAMNSQIAGLGSSLLLAGLMRPGAAKPVATATPGAGQTMLPMGAYQNPAAPGMMGFLQNQPMTIPNSPMMPAQNGYGAQNFMRLLAQTR